MEKHILAFIVVLLGTVSFADEKTEIIQTDLKFLCHINKTEKQLLRDKNLSIADTTERLAAMKSAAVRAQETKDALAVVSVVDKKDQANLWKQFAKDNKVKTDCF